MIVDVHTHIFPPSFVERHSELCRRDPTFAELYANPRAKLASDADLLASMERAGIERSVILGFAWQAPALCREHNDYLLGAAAANGGRLLPFCTLPLADPDAAFQEAERCRCAGALGFGELRPESQGTSLDSNELAELLTSVAERHRRPLLIHASEPVGHLYPGKSGQSLGSLYRFMAGHPRAPIIAAHWGGGLPLYALMPEVRQTLLPHYVDTAATSLLYDNEIFGVVAGLLGADRILFGSDFPLLSQQRQAENVRSAPLTDEQQAAVLGLNACRLLNLEE